MARTVIAFAVITYFIENAYQNEGFMLQKCTPYENFFRSYSSEQLRLEPSTFNAPGENQSFCSRHTPLLYSYSPPDGQQPTLPFDNFLWRPVSAYSFSWYFEVLPKAVNSALPTTPEILPVVHRDHTCLSEVPTSLSSLTFMKSVFSFDQMSASCSLAIVTPNAGNPDLYKHNSSDEARFRHALRYPNENGQPPTTVTKPDY